ncbi:hypothetical protein EUTSA_v10014888mg [Eutrema salsugineum]|uniref:EF-hand domain-containing protein n=1 Tax=Eutrema salsugineum TaxID=72664 RepID=V4LLF7_EUTSA|nr:hypothetical protein EUTSA_v10014888mg [Eutrema salsugineum]
MDLQSKLKIVEDIEADISRIFYSIDTEHLNRLTLPKLNRAFHLQNVPITDDQSQKLFDALDADHDGLITLTEYLRCFRPEYEDYKVRQAFDDADLEKVGSLTTPQAQQALSSLGIQMSLEETEILAFKRFVTQMGRVSFGSFHRMISYGIFRSVEESLNES